MSPHIIQWLEKMRGEIRAEGHAGWGNTLDDVIEYLKQPTSSGQCPSSIACARCSGEVVEFTVPNDIWNAVIRVDGRERDDEYLCLECWFNALRVRLTAPPASGQYPSDEQIACWMKEWLADSTLQATQMLPHIVYKACDWAAALQRERDAQICEEMMQGPVSHSPHDEARQDCADAIRSQDHSADLINKAYSGFHFCKVVGESLIGGEAICEHCAQPAQHDWHRRDEAEQQGVTLDKAEAFVLLELARLAVKASPGLYYPFANNVMGKLIDVAEQPDAAGSVLAQPAPAQAEPDYSKPPCQRCGALTLKEAENKCRVAGGDDDHCHGCDLWPDDHEQPPPAQGDQINPVRAVAVVEENELGDDPFTARIRYLHNPVPIGAELLWDHGDGKTTAPAQAEQIAVSRSALARWELAMTRSLGEYPIPLLAERSVKEMCALLRSQPTSEGQAMKKPTGKLAHAYNTIRNMEVVIERQKVWKDDAERYRWLRDRNHSLEEAYYGAGMSFYHVVSGVKELKHGPDLDAAVDAAISGTQPAREGDA